MLKKQTVWLLTMLSLMIVLSVYYMLSDGSDNLAYINDKKDDEQEAVPTESTEADDTEVTDITNVADDELFTTLRMQLQDKRNMKKERLTDVVASSSATTSEKDEALKDIDVLEDLSTKELVLEESIASNADYEDVLVRSDEDKVHVHVRTEKLSGGEANDIMQLVRDEFGEIPVDVDFQPIEEKEEQ